jgi:hypothetical protein
MQLQVHLLQGFLHMQNRGSAMPDQFGSMVQVGPQGTHFVSRAEGAVEQTQAMELLQPLAALNIGLASSDITLRQPRRFSNTTSKLTKGISTTSSDMAIIILPAARRSWPAGQYRGPFWLRFTGSEGVKEFLRMAFEAGNLLDEQVAKAAGFSVTARTDLNSVETILETIDRFNERFAKVGGQ